MILRYATQKHINSSEDASLYIGCMFRMPTAVKEFPLWSAHHASGVRNDWDLIEDNLNKNCGELLLFCSCCVGVSFCIEIHKDHVVLSSPTRFKAAPLLIQTCHACDDVFILS